MSDRYDAIIIGAGQAAKPLSDSLARADWKVAVIEKDKVGGTCINYGCSPTKTMVASSRVAYMVNRAGEFGINIPNFSVDMGTVRQRKRDLVESFRKGNLHAYTRLDNIDLIMGKAKFAGRNSVEIMLNEGGTREISADKIFINAGCRSIIPSIPGLEDVPFLDSTGIMELDEIPEHLMILGGGYIGIEFGQMFRRFGSKVSIIQRGNQLLAREDSDVAEKVEDILSTEGIEILLNSEAQRVNRSDNGEIEVRYRSDLADKSLFGSHLLVAVGRRPNSDNLNIDATGIEITKHGYVVVNNKLETSVPGIYSLGDINGGAQFTHISYDDYRIIRDNLLKNLSATTDDRQVPYVVFMDPQLGRVGLSEKEAKAAGINYIVAKIPMTNVARALEIDETNGFMKILVDAETNLILGCAILGIEGGEIMSIIQTAMMGKVPYNTLRDAVFAHPTIAESLNTVFMFMDR